jgi:signal transduction histidine kinase
LYNPYTHDEEHTMKGIPRVLQRFRVYVPLAAVLLVVLSVLLLLAYVIPAGRARLAGYAEDRAVVRAFAAASAVDAAGADASPEELRRTLTLLTDAGGGEVLVVNRQGEIVARGGERLLSPVPEEAVRAAAEGHRIDESFDGHRVATAPLLRDGGLRGGVVFVPGGGESFVNRIFLRSSIEAAALATVLGGGLALLLATLFSGRVERLTAGARAIEGGDLSVRLRPRLDDELGELARAFNSMAAKLEESFGRLEESRLTLNAILNNLSEGVLATNLDGRPMFANKVARQMLGLGEELPDRLPRGPWHDDFVLPEQVARCAWDGECPQARLSNGDNYFQVNLEHMPAFDDHRGGVLVVIRDLSEGRRLEANQQRFLANAAHELKTPITTILGASELLLTEEEDDTALRRRFLEHIFAEAQRMHRLSETLLQLARTGLDQRDPEVEPLDLGEVAEEAAGRIRPFAEKEGLRLEVAGSGGRVLADREWLVQALLVLLQNAVQHSGGAPVRVRLDGNAVAVEDEGEGIPEEDLPHVFERFHRGRGSSGGFGLGLPISRDLVERMGGQMSLESERGVGTTVEIRLPEAPEAAEEEGPVRVEEGRDA